MSQPSNNFPRSYDIDLGVIPLCAEMMKNGILVDVPYLQQLSAEWGDKLAELSVLLQAEAGIAFNPASNDDVADLLFHRLGLPHLKMTKGGEHKAPRESVDEEVLTWLEERNPHPLIPKLLEFREYAKLKSTYADALIARATADHQGRVHTTLKLTRTATGRLSSDEPNLQNIPTRTEEGQKIRAAFIAPPGKSLVSVDLSQIEMRVLAYLSQDPALLDIFLRGWDIHTGTAAQVAGVPYEQVTKAQRSGAKSINFGITYGQGPPGLAKKQGIPLAQAEVLVNSYFARFPGVKAWIDNVHAHVLDYGWIADMCGRRRYFPGVLSPDRWVVEKALRETQNMPVQSSATEIIKIAMAECWEQLPQWEFVGCLPLLQIHDELLYEALDSEGIIVGAVIKGAMESAVTLNLPIIADVKIGKRWSELEKVEV